MKILVDGTISSLIPEGIYLLLPGFLRLLIARIEISYWLKLNDFKGKVDFHYSVKKLTGKELLFFFSYKVARGRFQRRMKTLEFFENKVSHLSHYFVLTKQKADNLSLLTNLYLAGDSDVSQNAYFKHFFPWYNQKVIDVSFAVAPRFEVRKEMQDREFACVATGTFHNLEDETPIEYYTDFMTFFKTNTYHPVRKMVFENKGELAPTIACQVAAYRKQSKGNVLTRFINHFFVSQKKYFRIDIVELYNSYAFSMVGEEASGFPALGSLESMGAGCVLFAQPEFYGGLGINPGEHFLPYDGDVFKVKQMIDEGGLSVEELREISQKGSEFVKKNFSKEAVYNKTMQQLLAITQAE